MLRQQRNLGMVFRALCSVFLILGMSSTYAAEEGALTLRNQGIVHDALYDICFDNDNGMAVGVAGTVLESSDGGLNWASTNVGSPVALLGLDCHGQRPIAVGQAGALYIKQASGWEAVESGTVERLFSVSANQQGLAVAVGGFGAVLKSEDGGQSWNPIIIDWEAVLNDFLEPHVYDVKVAESGAITIAGEFELVMRSVDGGETWDVLNKADSSLSSMYWIDDATAFAVGQDGRVLRTADGGVTWDALDSGTNENLLDVWADADGTVVVTGIRTLLKSTDNGATFTSIKAGDVSIKWYQSVSASGGAARKVMMVGHSGRVVQVN